MSQRLMQDTIGLHRAGLIIFVAEELSLPAFLIILSML